MALSLSQKLNKIVVNVGVGKKATTTPGFESKQLIDIINELTLITGQKPQMRIAKKSIAGFKLRQGIVIGLKVTLRGKRGVHFLNHLIMVVLPRLRDFRGISLNNVDACGNMSIGLKEHIVFPEIDQETSRSNFGLQITIVPREGIRKEAIEWYRSMGFPFEKKES